MDDLTNKVFGELVVIQRDKDVITKEGYHIPTCDLSGEYGIGYTSNKGEMFYFDLDDYDKIKNYCWYSVRGKYLYGKIEDSHKTISMHKLLGFAGYDHIDRNGFNNRKSNLSSCSQKENTRNRSIPKPGIIPFFEDTLFSGAWGVGNNLTESTKKSLRMNLIEVFLRDLVSSEKALY